ncbi:hypothetical protein ACEPPN_017300 [Leptodophora sp. 'Broadleaf-Isolate-01']
MATLKTDTTAYGSTTATPAIPSAVSPGRSTAASYQPIAGKMRAILEQASKNNDDKGKQMGAVLFGFELVHANLKNLMSEKGFFPGFTQEQKLWYIDATLYDTFWKKLFGKDDYKVPCPSDQPQLSTGLEHRPSTPAQISTGKINNKVATPLSLSTEHPTVATLPCQNASSETGVTLADDPGLPTFVPLRTFPQTSLTQDWVGSGQDVPATGNPRSSKPQKSPSKSPYRSSKISGSGRAHINNLPANKPPFNLQMESSSLLLKRRTSQARGTFQRDVSSRNQPSNSSITKAQGNLKLIPIPGRNPDIKQMQSSPSMNRQQPPARPNSTTMMPRQQQINPNSWGGPTIAQYSPESMRMMATGGPLNMSFPPHSTTRPQQMQSNRDPRNNPMARQGSTTKLDGHNLSSSPIVIQNQSPHSQNYRNQVLDLASMRAGSYSQNHGQQNNPHSNFNGQHGYQPPLGSGLRNDSTHLAAGQYQQQNNHQRSHSDCTTAAYSQFQYPQSKYFMGMPIDTPPQGSPLQFRQPVFRHSHTPTVPTQNSSPYGNGHGHAHFAPNFANYPGQARPHPDGFSSPSPMHPQHSQVQHGAQMPRTNSAPPVYAQPDHQKYWSNGRGQPATCWQGGHPMVRGSGAATHNPNMPRQYLLPEDQARLDSGFNRKRNLEEFSEGTWLAQAPAKR